MTLTLTNVVIEDTMIIDHGITDDELKEMCFADVFDRVKDQLDPDMNYRFYANNEPLSLEDMDMFVYQDDVINILEQPAGTFTFAALLKMMASAVLSMAISFIANKLFGPKEVHPDDTQQNASYSLNNQQNTASPGEYAGVGYGTFRLYPKIINQPFTWYNNNDQYFGRVLSIGQGDYDVSKLQLGTTDMTNDKDVVFSLGHLNGATFSDLSSRLPVAPGSDWTEETRTVIPMTMGQTKTFAKSKEIKVTCTMGSATIGATETVTVKTTLAGAAVETKTMSLRAKETKSLTLTKEADGITVTSSGNKVTLDEVVVFGVKSGVSKIAGWSHDVVNTVDLVGNNAIKVMTSSYVPRHLQLKPNIAGVSINIVFNEGLYHVKGDGSLERRDINILVDILNKGEHLVRTYTVKASSAKEIKDAVRITAQYAKPANEDWSFVRVRREKARAPQSNIIDNPRLEAVYELYPNEPRYYGNTMLMAVAMRASENVQGGSKINVFARRTDIGNSIKDIVEDIYSNTNYGAGMDKTDLEFSDIAGHTKIDCYFEGEKTVLDCMEQVASPQMFHLVPRAQTLQVVKDVPKSIPVQKYDGYSMFNVSVEYKFDIKEQHDGIEVEYRDSDWNPVTTKYPAHSLQPKVVKVFGVSKKTVADTYAKYLYRQEKARKKVVSFSTDVQGRVPSFLDLIEINHPTVNSAEVAEMYQVVKAQVDEDQVKFEVINYDSSIYN